MRFELSYFVILHFFRAIGFDPLIENGEPLRDNLIFISAQRILVLKHTAVLCAGSRTGELRDDSFAPFGSF